jgi:integrase
MKGQNRGTINIAVSAIFHFFEMNDVLLNKRKVKRFMPADDESDDDRDRAYTHKEIQQLLLKCDERSRVIVLLMASTGMRIGAIPDLKLGHLTEIPKYGIYKISVYNNSKARYYTFTTPECAVAINSYLDYRRRFGDPLKAKSPLIREQFDINDQFAAEYPKQLKYDGIVYIIKEILKRSGLVDIRDKVMRSHGFRKFVITQFIKARVDYNTREYLVGHRHSRGLDVNYDRTSEEDRLEEYLKAVDLLTINEENRLKQRVEDLTLDTEKLSQLENELNLLKELVGK